MEIQGHRSENLWVFWALEWLLGPIKVRFQMFSIITLQFQIHLYENHVYEK